MLFDLVGTVVAGFAAAGLLMTFRFIFKARLPGWAMPVAAGAAMLAFAIWSEMSWGERTVATLPPGVEVVSTVEQSRPWRPWTYAFPQTVRMMAVGKGGAMTHAANPQMKLVDLYFFERWTPLRRIPQLVDCKSGARADVLESEALDAPQSANWVPLETDDPLLSVLCREGVTP